MILGPFSRDYGISISILTTIGSKLLVKIPLFCVVRKAFLKELQHTGITKKGGYKRRKKTTHYY